ncbi:MAG: hypothetical protein ACYTGZ_06270 [Planctomycetota bacterium]|jgi:hypothetical protein
MADTPNIGEILRRAALTNARFYAGLAELSVKYVQSLSEIFTGAQGTGAQGPAPDTGPVVDRPPQGSAALVLEGETGATARSFFLVENRLARAVTATPAASPLVDADGAEIDQTVAFEPAQVSLKPGEKIAVQVSVKIDRRLEAGKGYRGSITVPGLTDGAAGLVVRRLHPVKSPAPKKRAKKKATARTGKKKKKTKKRTKKS